MLLVVPGKQYVLFTCPFIFGRQFYPFYDS